MMRFRLRTLLTQFSIRDLFWLTLVVGSLTAWWHKKLENAALRDQSLARVEALKAESQALQAAAKKETSLRTKVDLRGITTQHLRAELAKRDAERRISLLRREDVLNALRTLKDTPAQSN